MDREFGATTMTTTKHDDPRLASVYTDGWAPRERDDAEVPNLWRAPGRSKWLRFGVTPFLGAVDLGAFGLAAVSVTGTSAALDLLLLVVAVLFYHWRHLYRSRLTLRIVDDVPALLAGILVGIAACAVAAPWMILSPSWNTTSQFAILPATFLGLVILGRSILHHVVRTARRRGLISHPTLMLGAGATGLLLSRVLTDHPEYGLRPIGFLDGSPDVVHQPHDIPVLGSEEALAQAIVQHGVHCVVVGYVSMPDSALIDLILTCERLDCDIFVVPRLFELHDADVPVDEVWGVSLRRLQPPAFLSLQWRLKRLIDVAVASIALGVLLPLMGIIALAVRLESGPDVLFRQQRIGRHERPFELLKFRSMRPLNVEESESRWSICDDARIGPIGRFLRSTSLDELPQLWNVVRGEMSLVGPRPERPLFVSDFSRQHPHYYARHRVPVGITGWAQIHGLRGDTSIQERVRFDNYYIANWSLWLDLRILLATICAVMRRAGS